MIDLFGMGRAPQEPQETPESPEQPAADAAPGSQRLWAVLLALDSLFVIVFGGAVATIVYKHWQAPISVAANVARARPAPKAPEAPKPEEPAVVKAPEPKKPAAKSAAKPSAAKTTAAPVVRHSDSPRALKPSMLIDAPKPHAAPALAGSGAASAPAAAPAASSPAAAVSAPTTKAQPVVFKLKASGAASVQLVGAFIVHGGRKEMTKGADGFWTLKLYLNRGQYRYFFSVDKKKTLDPENAHSDRGASLLTIP